MRKYTTREHQLKHEIKGLASASHWRRPLFLTLAHQLKTYVQDILGPWWAVFSQNWSLSITLWLVEAGGLFCSSYLQLDTSNCNTILVKCCNSGPDRAHQSGQLLLARPPEHRPTKSWETDREITPQKLSHSGPILRRRLINTELFVQTGRPTNLHRTSFINKFGYPENKKKTPLTWQFLLPPNPTLADQLHLRTDV